MLMPNKGQGWLEELRVIQCSQVFGAPRINESDQTTSGLLSYIAHPDPCLKVVGIQ